MEDYIHYKDMTYEQRRSYHNQKNHEYIVRKKALGYRKINGRYQLPKDK